jgi:hypothetical protein
MLENRGIALSEAIAKDTTVAKGQQRSNREAKKPKKTAAERLKASMAAADRQVARIGSKDAPKKA